MILIYDAVREDIPKTTLKVSGRGDPRDSVRQSAARRPATVEVDPKMYSGIEAPRDPCRRRWVPPG